MVNESKSKSCSEHGYVIYLNRLLTVHFSHLNSTYLDRAYTLAVKDLDDRPWEFVVKSWANGSEQRRVYVLEQASMFLRVNRLHEGDVIGICCDEAGNLQVAANTPALAEALARPNYSLNFARPLPKPVPGAPFSCRLSKANSASEAIAYTFTGRKCNIQ